MADGTQKPIELVRAGDWVASFDTATGQPVRARVTAALHHGPEFSRDGIVVVDGVLRVTTNHPLYVGGRAVRADELRVGDSLLVARSRAMVRAPVLLDKNRALLRFDRVNIDTVHTLERAPGEVETYDLKVDGPGTFFVDGILVLIKPV
jgi:hypothetical protein